MPACIVYAIRRKDTGEVLYVGASMRFTTRKDEHMKALANGTHYNDNLQKVSDSAGIDAITIDVLERVGDSLDLQGREQHYIDTLKPSCNIKQKATPSRNHIPLRANTSITVPMDLIPIKEAVQLYGVTEGQIKRLVDKGLVTKWRRPTSYGTFVSRAEMEYYTTIRAVD